MTFKAPIALVEALERAARDSYRSRSNVIRLLLGRQLGVACDQFHIDGTDPELVQPMGPRNP